MRKGIKFWLMLLVALFSLAFIAACGDSDGDKNKDNDKGNANKDGDGQVTIRWAHQWGEDHFWDGIGKDLKEKFPNINIEIQDAGTDHPEDLENLIAAKKSPDIVTLGVVTHVQFLEDLGLTYNMDDLVEEADFDLDRLEPSIVEFARKQDPNDENGLYAIPSARPTWSLHYNKDVFDKLGVDYPKDDMTWDDTIELAKELTREVEGVQYRGLDLDVPYDALMQLDIVDVDPDTDEVVVGQSEDFKRYIQMINDVVSIPGNYPGDEPEALFNTWGESFAAGNVAMAPVATNWGWVGTDNYDITTYPVWDADEQLNPLPNGGAYAITDPSEHKKEAFEIIEYLLSDEYQMQVSKEGQPSVLVNQDIHDVFAEDKAEFADKNLESLFIHGYVTGPERVSKYGVPNTWTIPVDYIESGKDVNEFIRVFQEKGEEYVREKKATE